MDKVKTVLSTILILVLSLAVVIPMDGCSMSKEEAQGHRDVLATSVEMGGELIISLAEERDAAIQRAKVAEAAADFAREEAERATAAMLNERIEDVNEYLAPQKEILTAWDARLANWDDNQPNNLGFVTDVGSSILPFLPAPMQGPAVLAVGIAGVIARLINRAKALNTLAASTVKLAEENPLVAEAIQSSAALMNSIQSNGAKGAVDAAQGDAVKLPV